MEALLKLLLGSFKSEKGRDTNRVLVVALCAFTAMKVMDLDKRVAVIEASTTVTAQGVTAPSSQTNSLAHLLLP